MLDYHASRPRPSPRKGASRPPRVRHDPHVARNLRKISRNFAQLATGILGQGNYQFGLSKLNVHGNMASIFLGILTVTMLFGVFWWWGLIRLLIKASGRFERPRSIIGTYLLTLTLSGGIITLLASDWLMAAICIIFPPLMFFIAIDVITEFVLWAFVTTFVAISIGFIATLGVGFFRSDKIISAVAGILLVVAPLAAQNTFTNSEIQKGYEAIGGECLSAKSFLKSMTKTRYLSLSSNVVGDFHAMAWVGERLFVWSYRKGMFVNIDPSVWKSFAPDNSCRDF